MIIICLIRDIVKKNIYILCKYMNVPDFTKIFCRFKRFRDVVMQIITLRPLGITADYRLITLNKITLIEAVTCIIVCV